MTGSACHNSVGKRHNALFTILNFKVEFREKKERILGVDNNQ